MIHMQQINEPKFQLTFDKTCTCCDFTYEVFLMHPWDGTIVVLPPPPHLPPG
ncbi:MAG: hypothetical protein PHR39_03055 [Actinomycetota bacterium]|nr:hypothetical protein [Actinomycetota bacterium]